MSPDRAAAFYTVVSMTQENPIMISRLVQTMLFIAILALAGCQKEFSDADLVFITPDQGKELVASPEGSLFRKAKPNVWVDPRRSEFYIAGHIPGAINVPYKDIAEEWEELGGYGVVIVYGQTYNDPLAEAMSKSLMEYGLGDIQTLKGGLEAWTRAGLPLTKGRKP